jgi:hypothetical protein
VGTAEDAIPLNRRNSRTSFLAPCGAGDLDQLVDRRLEALPLAGLPGVHGLGRAGSWDIAVVVTLGLLSASSKSRSRRVREHHERMFA